jgi:hypothetical protein
LSRKKFGVSEKPFKSLAETSESEISGLFQKSQLIVKKKKETANFTVNHFYPDFHRDKLQQACPGLDTGNPVFL